jgi:hypothetical protein
MLVLAGDVMTGRGIEQILRRRSSWATLCAHDEPPSEV